MRNKHIIFSRIKQHLLIILPNEVTKYFFSDLFIRYLVALKT